VGLQNVKTEINDIVKLVRYYRETGKDVLNRFALHTVFVGNPGTGKTTIARLIGKIYKALGILERGHVVEADRESLVAGFTGQTAIKTKEKIDAAMNGVLFVDEAYALDDNSFGRESIEVILKNMEDHRGKLALIVAGYPENMSKFLNSNPGLRSRFDRTFNFADYTPLELLHILDFMLKRYDLFLDEGAKLYLEVYIEEIYKDRDKYFGNAREIRKMVEDIVKKQNLRLASMPSDERTLKLIETVTIADVAHFEYKAAESKLGKIGFGSK
jgi:SpoVK/Ycf46/Vps4 family AAA+-type ATPase